MSWMMDDNDVGSDENCLDNASGPLGMFLLFVLAFFAN